MALFRCSGIVQRGSIYLSMEDLLSQGCRIMESGDRCGTDKKAGRCFVSIENNRNLWRWFVIAWLWDLFLYVTFYKELLCKKCTNSKYYSCKYSLIVFYSVFVYFSTLIINFVRIKQNNVWSISNINAIPIKIHKKIQTDSPDPTVWMICPISIF